MAKDDDAEEEAAGDGWRTLCGLAVVLAQLGFVVSSPGPLALFSAPADPSVGSSGVAGASASHLLMALPVPLMFWIAMSDRQVTAITGLGFCFASISMNLVNKQATGVFPSTALLAVLQMLITCVTLILMEHRKMTFKHWQHLAWWFLVPLFYSGVIGSGLWALKATTVSTLLILRNVLPLFALISEKYMWNTPSHISCSMVASMLFTIAGTVIFGYHQITVTPTAVFWVVLNCCIVTCDRLVQKWLISSEGFSVAPPLCMLVNNSVGMCLFIGVGVATGEIHSWPEALGRADASAMFWVFISGIYGCCIGYLGLRFQKCISATSFMVVQNANKVVLIFLSMVIFADRIKGLAIVGTFVSMLGALWYGYVRLPAEAMQAEQRQAQELKAQEQGAGSRVAVAE